MQLNNIIGRMTELSFTDYVDKIIHQLEIWNPNIDWLSYLMKTKKEYINKCWQNNQGDYAVAWNIFQNYEA